MTHQPQPGPWFWERPLKNQPAPALAALRTGMGREPGSVPAMWPYYTQLAPGGALTRELRAEHAALALYAIHQQSMRRPMHQPDRTVGQAFAILRHSARYSADAVERRVSQAATADDIDEVVHHLRSLIEMFKSDQIGFDYTRLQRDLRDWQYPDRVPRVRRRWGADFYSSTTSDTSPNTETSAQEEADQ